MCLNQHFGCLSARYAIRMLILKIHIVLGIVGIIFVAIALRNVRFIRSRCM